MSWRKPQPVNAPLRQPREVPKAVVPSYIGESEQILNLLMCKGAGGVVKDYSGQGNHGEISGAKWTDEYSPSWVLEFDGVDDYVDLSRIQDTGGTFSVSAWAKHDSPSDGDDDTIFISWYYDSIQFRDDGNGNLLVGFNTGAWDYFLSSQSINADTWYHYVVTYDGTDVKLYIDGSLDSLATKDLQSVGSDSHAIGYDEANDTRYFDGTIGEVRMYDRALSESEIKAIYQATKPLYVG